MKRRPSNKYIFSCMLSVLLFFFLRCSENKSVQVTLVENGSSDYSIFCSEKATTPERYAARQLASYFRQITGCELPLTNQANPNAKLIYVGFEGAPAPFLAGLDSSEFGGEEYVIRSVGDNLLIAGGRPRGTLYGVIGFLSDYLGCRWYTREVVNIPEKSTIRLRAMNDRQKPVFEYREAWYKEAYDTRWAVHNRLNPSIVSIPDSLGGSYKTFPFVHTFYQLVPPQKYFKTHPEYFSMISGERRGHDAQLCLTNPNVIKIATQTVFRWISEHPDVNVFSIDQNDGYGWCECPACAAVDKAEGSHSATVLNFVNQIADSVAKVYQAVQLQTLAYAYTEIPPKGIRPRPNVTIRMCHYEYCCAHSMEECERHRPFIERLNAWRKIAKRITIWDYFTDFNYYLLPFPNLTSVINNPRFYADHGCVGLFAQGCNVPANGGGEFAGLRAWLFARLMWDPYQNGQALIDEFVTNVYGPAAPFIRQYIDLLQREVKPKEVYFSIFTRPSDMSYLDPETVASAEKLFEKAEAAASADQALFKRDGFFIRVVKVDMERCTAAWRERVFDLLLQEEKIDKNVVRSMRAWPHSGFSIDNSVQITADDTEGMQRLVSYISRCPFSLARMIKVTETGQMIYRAVKSGCVRFPNRGDERLRQGVSHNFQVFEPLEFLAEVTQHIPNKGQHLIRYFGWYSNKKRGYAKRNKLRRKESRT